MVRVYSPCRAQAQSATLATTKIAIEKVFFAGWVSHERIAHIYALSDVFLLLSPLEGLPTVVLEAMTMEKPVIAASTGGQIQVIDNGINGLFVDPNNPKEIADKICLLIENEN